MDKFKALADETRIKIVKSLFSGKKTVSEIVPSTEKSQPNVSIALKQLLHAGIIAREKKGKFVHYSLKDPEKIKQIIRLVGGDDGI
ncbi:winged helix-turn-helix transcriptional regulator [Candidatus Woesearchaeota archaeon]|nr:winged helix-turn-helix transcriptional regulator [Candidatus Woesearchaeota archaeon]